MTNVIRKQQTFSLPKLNSNTKPKIVSANFITDIEPWDGSLKKLKPITLMAPVREQITIKADENGSLYLLTSSVAEETGETIIEESPLTEISLGTQYEHRVSWINFDLDNLIWNIRTPYNPDNNIAYTKELYYANYLFQLVFKNTETESYQVWEFDGITFEIPRELTETITEYDVILRICESNQDEYNSSLKDFTGNNFVGNIDSTFKECFVSSQFKAAAVPTAFYPGMLNDKRYQTINTSQKQALTKRAINCWLNHTGELVLFDINDTVETPLTEIGTQGDNCIRYLRFEKDLTAHLRGFKLFALFTQEAENNFRRYACSVFEPSVNKTDDEDAALICWIPSQVTRQSGSWFLTIVAVTDQCLIGTNFDFIVSESHTEEFYRFISNPVEVVVSDNILIPGWNKQSRNNTQYAEDFVTYDEVDMIFVGNSTFGGK